MEAAQHKVELAKRSWFHVAVAARIFTQLAGRSALILGAGDMAELAATCLVSEGVRVSVVANRTYESSRAAAESNEALVGKDLTGARESR